MAISMSITVWSVDGDAPNETENRNNCANERANKKSVRNPYVDIFVAIITVPTLILLALMLDANLQDDLGSNANVNAGIETKSSFVVLLFGFGFLVISLLACACIVHKMGICLWNANAAHSDSNDTFGSTGSGVNGNNGRTNDCACVLDMPPSYETVVNVNKLGNIVMPASPALLSTHINVPPPTYDSICLNACNHNTLGETSTHI